MVCGDCVQKLASKLIGHHKNLDWIRALELAEKGVERVESRNVVKSGNPTDYTLPCTIGTCTAAPHTCTKVFEDCTSARDCIGGACGAVSGTCGCPGPLPNSHQVSPCSTACAIVGTCARCVSLICLPTCGAGCLGTCGFDCDIDYEWDGEACVPIAVPPAKPLINKPLVNPILINPPMIRLVRTRKWQHYYPLVTADLVRTHITWLRRLVVTARAGVTSLKIIMENSSITKIL